jgi:hypothetical protein
VPCEEQRKTRITEMIDSTQIRTNLNVFLQTKVSQRLKNTLFNVMPTLEFIFALNGGDKTGPDGLGRPKTSVMVGALNGVAESRRESIFNERVYMPTVQKSIPATSEVKSMGDYDQDPTVSNWTTTNAPLKRFVNPRFKFARKKIPYKIPHSELRTAKAGGTDSPSAAARAIRSVYDAEVKTRMAVLCKKLNDELFARNSEPGVPTDEDAVTWDHIHCLEAALKTDNTYAGVDRSISANSWWRGNRDTTTRTWSFEDLINYCNYDLNMIDKGLGVQIIAVGKDLMKKAKAEAKAESYQLMTQGIPEFPEYGFRREVVRIYSGNRPVYVYYDPQVPSKIAGDSTNYVYALDPSTWTVAIHPESNFKVSTPADQTKVEGGDEADTGTIAAEVMIACEVPSGNAVFTDMN